MSHWRCTLPTRGYARRGGETALGETLRSRGPIAAARPHDDSSLPPARFCRPQVCQGPMGSRTPARRALKAQHHVQPIRPAISNCRPPTCAGTESIAIRRHIAQFHLSQPPPYAAPRRSSPFLYSFAATLTPTAIHGLRKPSAWPVQAHAASKIEARRMPDMFCPCTRPPATVFQAPTEATRMFPLPL
jgi:hypothetical protein